MNWSGYASKARCAALRLAKRPSGADDGHRRSGKALRAVRLPTDRSAAAECGLGGEPQTGGVDRRHCLERRGLGRCERLKVPQRLPKNGSGCGNPGNGASLPPLADANAARPLQHGNGSTPGTPSPPILCKYRFFGSGCSGIRHGTCGSQHAQTPLPFSARFQGVSGLVRGCPLAGDGAGPAARLVGRLERHAGTPDQKLIPIPIEAPVTLLSPKK